MTDKYEFHSINPETGMLEDKEEIREEVLSLIWFVKGIMQHPIFQMLVPVDVKLDFATVLVNTESMLRLMSQKDFLRHLTVLTFGGVSPYLEMDMAQKGYSDTLPRTHPQAPHPALDPIDPNHPVIRQLTDNSHFFRAAMQEVNKTHPLQEATPPTPPPVSLTQKVEDFLTGLWAEDETVTGDDNEGDQETKGE